MQVHASDAVLQFNSIAWLSWVCAFSCRVDMQLARICREISIGKSIHPIVFDAIWCHIRRSASHVESLEKERTVTGWLSAVNVCCTFISHKFHLSEWFLIFCVCFGDRWTDTVRHEVFSNQRSLMASRINDETFCHKSNQVSMTNCSKFLLEFACRLQFPSHNRCMHKHFSSSQNYSCIFIKGIKCYMLISHSLRVSVPKLVSKFRRNKMALNYIRSLFPLNENSFYVFHFGKIPTSGRLSVWHVPLSQLSESLNVQRAVNKCQLTDCGTACCTIRRIRVTQSLSSHCKLMSSFLIWCWSATHFDGIVTHSHSNRKVIVVCISACNGNCFKDFRLRLAFSRGTRARYVQHSRWGEREPSLHSRIRNKRHKYARRDTKFCFQRKRR